VKAALSKLGCPYVLGAKGDRRFDCSGLVYYAVGDAVPVLKSVFYTNAAGQARYLFEHGKLVGRSELMPGDLVFWRNRRCTGCGRWNEIHHVGIYAGNGKVIEASSSRGCVVIRELWSKESYPVFMYGRPY
jgi:cell wall-associated NlpC family hydrolase